VRLHEHKPERRGNVTRDQPVTQSGGVSTGTAIEDGVDQCDEARAAAIEAVADSGNEILACEEAGITQSIFRSQ